jgi:hypothetical protein
MDIYNAWFGLKPGVSDMEFSDRLTAYMDHLKNDGLMQGWRLMRRKLGLSAAPRWRISSDDGIYRHGAARSGFWPGLQPA